MKISAKILFTFLLVVPTLLNAAAPEKEMSTAAQRFHDALTPEQRGKAIYEWNDDERFDWHFIPKPRKGLPFKEMTDEQKPLAHALVKTALSKPGYLKVTNIMSLENILFEMENKSPMRDIGLYYITIFGSPQKSDWGWRLEGHHLSLNFFIFGGKLASVTPSFLGTNPAEIPGGPRKGLRVLAAEEDLARELVKSLTDEQKKIAVIATAAPRDIITGNSRKAKFLEPVGLGYPKMNPEQQKRLIALIDEYIRRYRAEIADADMKRIQKAGLNKLSFAWAGGLEPGEGHYYRIQGPTFLMEFDNTQNNANHVHCVWRDLEKDFGDDVLAKHYEQAPHLK